jgi:hypothetical protein
MLYFLIMKFIEHIDFKDTKPRTFFAYSGLSLVFSEVADIANIYIHVQNIRSIFDTKQSAVMQILTSDTVISTIETYSILNANSACVFAIAGIARLVHPPQQKRPKITNPWRPSV